jgi:Queuosine biosynthesis protein QueC
MIITCGPEADRRTLNLILPNERKKIAVLISGGIDSAILYYLMLEENKNLGYRHEIVPVTIPRTEGSEYFGKLVVASMNQKFNLIKRDAIIVGNASLPDDKQVRSGVLGAYELGFDLVYGGVIEQQPEHMVGWTPPESRETKRFKTPLKDLNKIHIIDLVIQCKQEDLFCITHTCNKFKVGRCHKCNGCNERAWGFSQLGLTDPGTI